MTKSSQAKRSLTGQLLPGWRRTLAVLFCGVLTIGSVSAQSSILLGMGDSIGEGVQSADASWRTQPFSYLNLIARQMAVPFDLPLIESGPLGVVGETLNRSRLQPFLLAHNLSVSGAEVKSILDDRANATTPDQIDSETDLVLFPRLGSQTEIAEQLYPPLIVCWIGNNDVLEAATSFNQLDASQMTSVEDFSARFGELTQRLQTAGSKVVYATIPDVTNIGFLMNRQDLIKFLGSDFGLAEGDYTTVITMLLIRLGLNDGSLLQNPDFVLDVSEVALVQERIEQFNQIMGSAAAAVGSPVVDVNGVFDFLVADPPLVLGVPLTPRFLGGLFSLDGVHPSNIAHAILANSFIEKINSHFQTDFPVISDVELLNVFLQDPFVDKDGDARVSGRPFAGLLETLGPLLGISGDRDDTIPETALTGIHPELGQQFLQEVARLRGRDLKDGNWTFAEILEAFRWVFGR